MKIISKIFGTIIGIFLAAIGNNDASVLKDIKLTKKTKVDRAKNKG